MPVLDCMLDVPIFVEQHAQICEGLTTLQLLPSNCPYTSVMATAKDNVERERDSTICPFGQPGL